MPERSGRPAVRAPGLAALANMPVAWQQAAVMTIIVMVVVGLARVGLGAVARPLFMLGALAAAIFYIRRSPWHYLTWTVWLWTLTPMVRRLIDYNSGFDPVNYMLATPNLLTLLMLKDILTSRDLMRQRESFVGLLLIVPILYGLMVSLVQGQVVSGLVAAADWISPVLYYFYVIANWRRITEADGALRNFLAVNSLFVVGYGIVQYFNPLPWDVAWVLDSGINSVGIPEPYELRVFSTTNAPGVLAIWLGTILLLFLHFRTSLAFFLVPAAILLLMMTLVRSVAGTLVLGLLLAGVMGRAGTFKVIGGAFIGIILVWLSMSAIDPNMSEHITKRFDTLNNLSGDNSAVEREAIYRAAPGLIDANPLGLGIGALGRGAVVSNNAALVTIDSGPLVIFYALGWVGGAIYSAGILLALGQGLLAARATRSPAALALAVGAAAGATNLVFSGMAGLFAVLVWFCTAYAATIGIAHRNKLAGPVYLQRPHVPDMRIFG